MCTDQGVGIDQGPGIDLSHMHIFTFCNKLT